MRRQEREARAGGITVLSGCWHGSWRHLIPTWEGPATCHKEIKTGRGGVLRACKACTHGIYTQEGGGGGRVLLCFGGSGEGQGRWGINACSLQAGKEGEGEQVKSDRR